MDVYDFDKTLYQDDSTVDFVRWCLRRHPRVALDLPRIAAAAVMCFGLHRIDKTRFKRALYRFVVHIPDIEREIERFWKAHEHKIGGPCTPHPGDLVISASPEFLLRGVCARHGWQLLASPVDPHTGAVLGPNCSGREKVVRFREAFPGAEIDHFYSDSHNDDPLAGIAHEAFMVEIKKNRLAPWPR